MLKKMTLFITTGVWNVTRWRRVLIKLAVLQEKTLNQQKNDDIRGGVAALARVSCTVHDTAELQDIHIIKLLETTSNLSRNEMEFLVKAARRFSD